MVVHLGFLRAPSSAVVDGASGVASFDSNAVEVRVFHTHVHNRVCTWARTQVSKRLGRFALDRHKPDCFGRSSRRTEKTELNQSPSVEPIFAAV